MKRLIVIFLIMTSMFLIGCGDSSPDPAPPVMPAYNGTAFYGDGMTANCDAFINGTNRGVTGHTSGMMLNVIESNLTQDTGKRYHILIGLNDIFGGMDDSYINNIGYAVDMLPDRAVILTSILPTYHGDYNASALALNAQLSSLANGYYNVAYRDVNEAFTQPPYGIINSEYSDDGLNLNAAGCQKLYDGI